MQVVVNDGSVIETDSFDLNERFEEERYWNGFAHVGKCSYLSLEDSRQYLYCKKDKYYLIEFTVDSKVKFAKRLRPEHAVGWLLFNNHQLPTSLDNIAISMTQ